MQINNVIRQYSDSIKDQISKNDFINLMFGLIGETGEVVDVIKKMRRDEQDDVKFENHKNNLKEEIGDVFWYLIKLIDYLNLDLQDILNYNIIKTNGRNKCFENIKGDE